MTSHNQPARKLRKLEEPAKRGRIITSSGQGGINIWINVYLTMVQARLFEGKIVTLKLK